MRRVLLTTIGLLAVAATAAVAADLPRAMPARAPAYIPIGYNWTGFYLGINGGYAWGRSHWNSFGSSSDPSGAMVGGTAGYNWQAAGSPWVFGLEGDLDWTNIKASQPGFAGVNDTNVGWSAGAGIEAALAGNWTAKLEYLHVDLGHTNCVVGACALSTRVGFHADEVRAGVNYRF